MAGSALRMVAVRPLILVGITGFLTLIVVTMPPRVSAHETRTVATEYESVVGFVDEPAIAGEVNGVLLEVATGGQPVENVSDTLQAQILYGDQTKEVTLTPSFAEPGVYTAPFIPTAGGDYTFRFFGQIEGIDIDETFTSSPEGFASVEPRSAYEFPVQVASTSRNLAMPAVVGGLVLTLGALGVLLRRRQVI